MLNTILTSLLSRLLLLRMETISVVAPWALNSLVISQSLLLLVNKTLFSLVIWVSELVKMLFTNSSVKLVQLPRYVLLRVRMVALVDLPMSNSTQQRQPRRPWNTTDMISMDVQLDLI